MLGIHIFPEFLECPWDLFLELVGLNYLAQIFFLNA